MICFRKANKEDCRDTFEWRTDPETMKMCFSKEEIPFETHAKWFHDSLSNPKRTILIAENEEGEKIGQLRFDDVNEGTSDDFAGEESAAEIGIVVAPESRGKGVGTELLNEGCKHFLEGSDKNMIIARIRNENIASTKAFTRAGFVKTKEIESGIQMELRREMISSKFGLKIYSTNHQSFPKLKELYEKGICQYVEILLVPGSFDETKISILKGIPIIFHAPCAPHNFNLRVKEEVYLIAIDTIKQFTEFFEEKKIIFHPGLEVDKNDIEEVKKNISELKEMGLDIILENVPKMPAVGTKRTIAAKFEEFEEIIKETGARICVDITHAIAAANHYNKEPLEYLKKFISLNPYMFHVCDSDIKSEVDSHNNLGEGSFPLPEIMSMIPKSSHITLETPKEDFLGLSEDIRNLEKLKSYIKGGEK
jgi:deoxyribonuclease IV